MDLRMAYFLPEPLKQYVGPVGTYADVDEILQQNMQTMKVGPALMLQLYCVGMCCKLCAVPARQFWPLRRACSMLSLSQSVIGNALLDLAHTY